MTRSLHIISGLWTGGAETVLLRLLSRGLAGPDGAVVVALNSEGPLAEPLRALPNVTVHGLGMSRGALPSPRMLSQLRRLVRSADADVIQGWMYHGNLAATLAARFSQRRVGVAWNVRQSLYVLAAEQPLTRWVIRASAWASRSPDCIIYNSHVSRGQHAALGFRDTTARVIPNGFDVAASAPASADRIAARELLGLPQDRPIVGLVARVHPMKDHENFLRAAALLSARMPAAYFALIGHGADAGNARLSALISRLGLLQRVALCGEIRNAMRVHCAFDVACSASWAEAFPNVLGEAMSCGVPCVATDVGDSRWLVGDTGRIVPARDPTALSSALAEMLELTESERQALGTRARTRIETHFRIGAVVDEYRALYAALASAARQRS